jgi:hypothetical protein
MGSVGLIGRANVLIASGIALLIRWAFELISRATPMESSRYISAMPISLGGRVIDSDLPGGMVRHPECYILS